MQKCLYGDALVVGPFSCPVAGAGFPRERGGGSTAGGLVGNTTESSSDY